MRSWRNQCQNWGSSLPRKTSWSRSSKLNPRKGPNRGRWTRAKRRRLWIIWKAFTALTDSTPVLPAMLPCIWKPTTTRTRSSEVWKAPPEKWGLQEVKEWSGRLEINISEVLKLTTIIHTKFIIANSALKAIDNFIDKFSKSTNLTV